MHHKTRSGFISIVGSTNAGKSTLMNALIGQKVAIVSRKAQTTRNRIRGVLTEADYQIVFIDTPGIHTPHNRLGEFMVNTAYAAARDVECVLFVADPIAGLRERDEAILARIRKGSPVIAAINKIDIASDEQLKACEERLAQEDWIDQTLRISAARGDGLDALKEALQRYLVEGPQYFPDDMVTDQPERVICAEMIREATLECLDEEVPHGIGVDIDKIEQRETGTMTDIWATIYCERESHKGIVIGKQGAMLKRIGSKARPPIEWMMDTRVNLQLWVKVRENWRDKTSDLRMFGYVDQN